MVLMILLVLLNFSFWGSWIVNPKFILFVVWKTKNANRRNHYHWSLFVYQFVRFLKTLFWSATIITLIQVLECETSDTIRRLDESGLTLSYLYFKFTARQSIEDKKTLDTNTEASQEAHVSLYVCIQYRYRDIKIEREYTFKSPEQSIMKHDVYLYSWFPISH